MGGEALILAGVALVFLIASGLWAERRFAAHAKLPLHYGPTLKPTRFGSRRTAIWFPTGIMGAVLVMNIVLMVGLDGDQINGDPDFGLILVSFVVMAAQVFILWLHSRWARTAG